MNQILSSQNQTGQQRLHIQENVPLADKNWFKTGGPARFYCKPKTEFEFAQALQFAQEKNIEIFILGQGANILISDDGFDGLVIHSDLQNISHVNLDAHHALVAAGSGTVFNNLIEYCLQNNLTNLEEFSGIPGTVGGSVFINLHYYDFFLADFLVEAKIGRAHV